MKWLLAFSVLFSSLAWAQNPGDGAPERPDEELQTSEEPIRVDVNLVTVRFTVRDSAGQLVNTLGQDQFQVSEAGEAREVVFFESPRNEAGTKRRLWLAFLLDVSGSTFATRSEEIIAAQTFLDNVHDFTQVGIFGFTDELLTFQDFTSNRSVALRAFSSARRHLGQTAIYDSANALIDHMNSEAAPEDRKAIIVISDGMDNNYRKSASSVFQARRHDITLYTIVVPSAAQLYIGPARWPDADLPPDPGLEEQEAKEAAFSRLSVQTGGRHFSGIEAILDFDQTLAQINDDIFGNLYSLGYHTEDPYQEKTARRIQVGVRRPDLVVSSLFKNVPERLHVKKRFIAALFGEHIVGEFPDNFRSAIREIGAEVDVLPGKREGGQFGIPFRVKISPFTLRGSRDEGVRTQLGILGVLVDSQGKEVVRLREFFRVSLAAKDIENGRGIIYTNKLLAPPGDYQLKIALLEIATWKMAAFEEHVTVR
ncbi:MAG: VWA domain-containing protein [Acidobacteriota bacterium]